MDSLELLPVTMPLLELPPVARSASLKVGDCLGKLLLTDAMGEGATGRVFRALHQTLKIPVAVKILQSTELERDPGLRQQLRAEAQLLAQLNHPNIIRVWDFEDSPHLPYIVLEIVEGLSLAELITQSGRLLPRQAVDLVIQIADGLDAAHQLGIIHRDVKPGNILLTRARVPKLADLGLAVVTCANLDLQASTDSGRLINVAGTPAYMAPEQFLAPERVDHRSDIYSLGVTLYHALTGQLPFEGSSPRQVMLSKVQSCCTPPHGLIHGLDASVSEVVMRMIEKDPDERYANYDELLQALRALRDILQPTPVISSNSSLRINASPTPSSPRTPPPATPTPVTQESASGPESDLSLAKGTQKVPRVPQGPDKLLEAGVHAGRSGDRERARELLQHAIRRDPTYERAWLWLAAFTDTPEDKIEALRRVLELNPDHEKARAGLRTLTLQLGVAEARRGHREEARKLLTESTDLDPQQELAWLWRAQVAASPHEAIDCLHRVLKINPENDRARAGLEWHQSHLTPGWTCPLCGAKAARAQDECPSCLSLVNLTDLAVWKARSPISPERIRRVENRCRQTLRSRPDAPTHWALALAYLNGHQFDRGAYHLQAAVRCRPEDKAFAKQVETFVRALAAKPPSAPGGVGWQGTILVVDDSATIRKVVSRALAEYDYRVLEAADGEAALSMVQQTIPDLVLLDICMPGMDGYQVCRALRSRRETASLPVLMLSGKDGLFDKFRGRMAGATEYLTKPFRPEMLIQVIEKYCQPKRDR